MASSNWDKVVFTTNRTNDFDQGIYRYALDWAYIDPLTLPLTPRGTTEKEDDMKTPRSFFQFLIVYNDDTFDVHGVIAETELDGRDTIVQDRLLKGVKAKDVEIKLLNSVQLKPRVAKDG